VIKLLPIIISQFIGTTILYNLCLDSVDNIYAQQTQFEAAISLIYQSDLAFDATIESVVNQTTLIKGEPARVIGDRLRVFTTQASFWREQFLDSNGQLSQLTESVLFHSDCNDQRISLDSADVSLCYSLSSGSGSLGLFNIFASLSRLLSTFSEMYFSSPQSQSDLMTALEYSYTVITPINFYENNFLLLLMKSAYDNFMTEISDNKVFIIESVAIILVLIIFMLMITVSKVLHKIIARGNEVKSIVNLVPFQVIMATRALKDYLIKSSGKIGDSLKRYM
jgi:hypothetical protein